MTIIDAHHHVWDLSVRDQDWIDQERAAIRRSFGLADLAGPASAAGVTGTVVVQTVPVAAETPELLALAARAVPEPSGTVPDQSGAGLVSGVVGWVDLTDPGVGDALAALRDTPGGDRLVGIRHIVEAEPDPRWLARPEVRRGLRAVADAGLCYDLLTKPHQLPAAIQTVRELPELRFVLDHLSKPPIRSGELRPWADHMRVLAEAGNVAAKLSGMVTEADWHSWSAADLRPYAEVALECFGPDRLMFGSDWPVCLLAGEYAEVVGAARELVADLSGSERAAVFAGTARRWYALPDAG